jgi:hypothetical protein
VALKEVEGGSAHAPTPRKFHAACSLYPWHPLLVVFGGWRTNTHFEDLHVAALGTDTKALEPYARSDLSTDAEEAEDGLLEVRVYVPDRGMETLRTSRSRLRLNDAAAGGVDAGGAARHRVHPGDAGGASTNG